MAETGTSPRKRTSGRASTRKSAADKAEEKAAVAQAEPATPGVQDTPNPATTEAADSSTDAAQETRGASEDDVAKASGNKEAGRSVAAFEQGDDPVPTAPTGDDPRNGKPVDIGTSTDGPSKEAQASAVIAATGGSDRNGAPVEQRELGQTDTKGPQAAPAAQLLAEGVRGEVGTGTGIEAPEDKSADYPTRALNRKGRGKPFQPDDHKRQAEPRQGDAQTSTDATAANAVVQSFAGDEFVKLVDEKGNEVKPSDFLTVPENGSNAVRVVDRRIAEEYTVRRTSTTSQRLLFPKGAEVPVAVAERLIAQHG